MKKLFFLLLILALTGIILVSCDKEEDEPQYVTVAIGAQDNDNTGGFYSVSEKKVYTMDQAFQNQSAIDILCFYEEANGNNIAIASPGSGITGIFTGASSVENWTTTDTTFFSTTTLTPEQFDALENTDALIESSFDTENQRKKAKDLKVDDIYAIHIQSGEYGLLKVTAVTQGTNGSVTFELKMKK